MKFKIYRDRRGEYRWRLIAANGRTVADSAEGYDSRSNARRAAENVKAGAGTAPIEDEY